MAESNGDFISDFYAFLSASADARSPEIYRKWASISTLAGALERRVWVETGPTSVEFRPAIVLI